MSDFVRHVHILNQIFYVRQIFGKSQLCPIIFIEYHMHKVKWPEEHVRAISIRILKLMRLLQHRHVWKEHQDTGIKEEWRKTRAENNVHVLVGQLSGHIQFCPAIELFWLANFWGVMYYNGAQWMVTLLLCRLSRQVAKQN